jgi:hypothetical protein
MSKPLPLDVEEFLYALGTFEQAVPGAFEAYAKTAATLLWEKYVMFEDALIDTTPNNRHRYAVSSKLRQN